MTNMPFAKLMTGFRGGALEVAASEKMQEVLEAMAMHGGNGSVTVKFKFKRDKYDRLEVFGEVRSTKPEGSIAPGIYFMTDDHQLTQRDPNQSDIEDYPGVKRMTGTDG